MTYRIWRSRLSLRKIMPAHPQAPQIRREILYSLSSVVILSASMATAWGLSRLGWSRFYWDIPRHGWAWIPASVLLTIFLWDAWFYWTHRAMHHRRLFRWFHRTHHLSHNPTPWTTYSLDPLEAGTYGVFTIVVSVLYPLHPSALVLFMAFQFLWNLGIHSGFEVMPRWFPRSWTAWWLSSPTSHVLHHETSRGNFGFCFQFWDRWMGTCHPDYDQRLQSVVDRAHGPG